MSIAQNQVQYIGGTQIIINALGASSFQIGRAHV